MAKKKKESYSDSFSIIDTMSTAIGIENAHNGSALFVTIIPMITAIPTITQETQENL